MALAFVNRLNEGSTTGGDPVTTAGSITTAVGSLHLIQVVASVNTADIVSITGPSGQVFARIEEEARGALFIVHLYYLLGTAAATGTITVDFDEATTGTVIICDEVTGHHTTTPVRTANVIVGNGTDAAAPTDVTLTLPSALADANNAIYSCWANNTNADVFTAGTDYTKLGNAGHNTPARAGATEYDVAPGDLITDGSFASASQWAGVAVEIAVAAAGGDAAKPRMALLGVGSVLIGPAAVLL